MTWKGWNGWGAQGALAVIVTGYQSDALEAWMGGVGEGGLWAEGSWSASCSLFPGWLLSRLCRERQQ